MAKNFWDYLDHLFERSDLVVDRPKGSTHPRYEGVEYPLDYGYLKNSISGDGQGLDVWIGSNPERGIEVIICTIDLFKSDLEIKVLVGCSHAEQKKVLDFQNTGNMRAMLVRRQRSK